MLTYRLSCELQDGILLIQIFEDDFGDNVLLGEAVLPISDYQIDGELRVDLQQTGAVDRFVLERIAAEKHKLLGRSISPGAASLSAAIEQKDSCGQIRLEIAWNHPEDEHKARYTRALQELHDHTKQLADFRQGNKRQKRDVEDEDMDDVLRPQESPQCVLVHVFTAQNVPVGDKNGSCDPFIKASIAGTARRTSAKPQTLFPSWYVSTPLFTLLPCTRSLQPFVDVALWSLLVADCRYETLPLKGNFPVNQDYFNTGLVPPLVLQVLDHDKVFKDDLLGHCVIQLRNISAEMPERPTWHPIKLLGSGEVAGRVLVSLQIVPIEKLSDKIPRNLKINRLPIGKLHGRVPTPLEVGMRRCTVEFFLLGCRRLQPKGHIKPRSPFVTCKLNGDTVRGLIQTAPQSNPTPVGPNYLETLRINCWLPDRPTFSPSITISVFDRQFGVLNPLLGTACIQLQRYLPWIPKNRQRIKARYALSGADATAADQQD
eukprot:COSAG02_NODE_6173_length_3751_cov_2.355422_3_plen_486_part_01